METYVNALNIIEKDNKSSRFPSLQSLAYVGLPILAAVATGISLYTTMMSETAGGKLNNNNNNNKLSNRRSKRNDKRSKRSKRLNNNNNKRSKRSKD